MNKTVKINLNITITYLAYVQAMNKNNVIIKVIDGFILLFDLRIATRLSTMQGSQRHTNSLYPTIHFFYMRKGVF